MEKFIALICLVVAVVGVVYMSIEIVDLKNELYDKDQRIKNLVGYVKLLTKWQTLR